MGGATLFRYICVIEYDSKLYNFAFLIRFVDKWVVSFTVC